MDWFTECYEGVVSTGIRVRELLHHEQSPHQAIRVFDTIHHGRMLVLDKMVMLTESDEFVYHEMLVHMAMAGVERVPERALVIGGGDGGSVRELLRYGFRDVTLCEIDERVVRVCQELLPSLAGSLSDPRVRLVFEDAAEFVRGDESFDVIIIDGSEAVGPAEVLFTRRFLADVVSSLRPGGVMTMQVGSPVYAGGRVAFTFETLNSIPGAAFHAFRATVPTYPGGEWVFARSGDVTVRAPPMDGSGLRYFSTDVALASLRLPRYIADLVR